MIVIYCLLYYITLLIADCNVKLYAYSYLLLLVLTCLLMCIVCSGMVQIRL